MSTFKKLLALTLALAMVLSVSAFAGYSKDTYKDAADIDPDCESAIELMYALDIMTGDNLGNFNPKATITRGEMAKMIYVILNYGEDDLAVNYKGAKFFSDVNAGDWYEGYVNYMAMTKLVQGRPDGTFGPNDPVTTAEAAKMLLTALGYSAADRGYTGANWAQNVLSDAAILQLLKGYNYSTTGYAPRQWVAVMVENALNCYTIDTMKPTFGGLLISGVAGSYETMGQKYYGYTEVTGIMTSANGYYIDTVKAKDEEGKEYTVTTSDGYVIVGGVKFEADATIEDLGQEFKAIVIDGEAISLRNTGKSVVAEDEVKDVTYELVYGTSGNAASNKYEFTVDELTGKADTADGKVNVLDVKYGNKTYEEQDSAKLKTEIGKGAYRNDIVRAIDADGKGDIEYVIYTPVEYAVITKAATSQKYGNYVKATAADGTALTVNGGSNLYIEDCIICEDELEVGNFVKFTWNIDEAMYNVEILPVAEFIEFDSRKVTKNEYTFDGETYNKAANAFVVGVKDMVDLSATGMLGDDFDIVVDGDLLVYAIKSDDNYKSMDEVNAKLAVLVKARVGNAANDENDKQVKLLTIDGEQAWYAYDVTGAVDAYADNAAVLKWSKLTDDLTADYEEDADWDQLVIVHTNDDGEVYLETIPGAADWETAEPYTDLNLPTTLVDSVTDKIAELKVTETSVKFDGVKVASDNQFFAQIEGEYCVVTAAELTEGTYSGVDAQALVNIGNNYDTIVGGYLIIDEADPTTASGYLFVLDQEEKQYEDDDRIVYVLFDDGTEGEIEISTNVTNDFCYYYTFDGENYTLTFAWASKGNASGDEEGTLWYGKNNAIDTSDYDTIALKTVVYERAQLDGKWEPVDGADQFVSTDAFVTAEDLAALVIEIYGADATNEYIYTVFDNVTSNKDNHCLFVELAIYMNANQEYEDQKPAQ